MVRDILLSLGAILIISCGSIHILLTKLVINGFTNMSEGNKKVTFMEWIVEGLTLNFIGILVLIITFLGLTEDVVSKVVLGASFVLLLIMTILSLMTVLNLRIDDLTLKPNMKRITAIHLKGCPIIKFTSGILFLLGNLL